MAAPSAPVDATSPQGQGFVPGERDLARSEEEEKLLKKIREEKERLWCEIQVSVCLLRSPLAFSGVVELYGRVVTCSRHL